MRNGALRRVLVANAAFNLCEHAMWIAMMVVAYQRGGATEAGVVALAQLVPSALVGFWTGRLATRWSLSGLLLTTYAVQGLASAVVAVALLTDAPVLVAYAAAVVASGAVPVVRPVQSALLPALARRPAELTSSNVVLNVLESSSILVAGLVTGALIALQGPGAVFVLTAVLLGLAAVVVLPLRGTGAPVPAAPGDDGLPPARRLSPASRTLTLLIGTEFVVIGALDVLFVVLAVDVLDAGSAWAGYLNTAYGVGSLLAGAVAVAVMGRRLGPVLVPTALVLGAALALTPTAGLAGTVVLLVVVGAARALLDVCARVLLQRSAPPEELARVFAIGEGLSMAALAVGSLLVPVLIGVAGPTGAVVAAAALLPLHVLLTLRTVHHLDRDARLPVVQLALLRHVPIFRALPPAETEALATAMRPVAFGPGEVIVRQGEPGDLYYVLCDGAVRIDQDARHAATLGRGDGLGEVALMRGGLRTATATATTPVSAYSLDREDFLHAVVGHGATRGALERWVQEVEERDEQRRRGAI